MKRRSAWLGLFAALTVGLLAVSLIAGCESGTPLNTSVSIDSTTQQATIHISTNGDGAIIALFLVYPDGHREMPLKGNVGKGGGTLNTGELPPGEYGYTVYWILQGNRNVESVSADQIVENGQAVTGDFTIP